MQTLTDFETIQAVIKKPLVMIVAKTKTCSTCKMIIPHLENSIRHLDAFEQYEVYIDDLDVFRGHYVIFSVPTVLLFSQGKELLRESRFININKINRMLDAFLENA